MRLRRRMYKYRHRKRDAKESSACTRKPSQKNETIRRLSCAKLWRETWTNFILKRSETSNGNYILTPWSHNSENILVYHFNAESLSSFKYTRNLGAINSRIAFKFSQKSRKERDRYKRRTRKVINSKNFWQASRNHSKLQLHFAINV